MTPYETSLRFAYKAFYEHPYKSEKMFDAMEKTADVIFHDTTNVSEETWAKLCDKFYMAFCNNARSEDEKKAIESLVLLSVL